MRQVALPISSAPFDSFGLHEPIYVVVVKRAAHRYRELPWEARQVIRLCDGVRSHRAICRESPVDRVATSRILARLKTLELIKEVSHSLHAPATSLASALPGIAASLPEIAAQIDETFAGLKIEPVPTVKRESLLLTEKPSAISQTAGAKSIVEGRLSSAEVVHHVGSEVVHHAGSEVVHHANSGARSSETRPSKFSEDEEAFFSQSLDHLVAEEETRKYGW